jgi:subtilase family serine protease
MKSWKLGAVALATLFGVAGVSSVPAAPPSFAPAVALERYGNTYAVSVCGRSSPVGTAHCFAKAVTDARGTILENRFGPNRGPGPNASAPAGYGASTLQAAYGLSATGGSGKTIAVVDAYGYTNAEADLAVYRKQMGLPDCTTANGCFTKVNQTGGKNYPRQDTGWAQEQALDLDMVSAACPNCKILLVQATNNSFNNLAAAVDYAASRAGVVAISNSYGGPEFSSETSLQSHYNNPVAKGIAVTVSSGDNGFGTAFPAAAHDVTAVGGTHLVMNGASRVSETVWSGSGSGCSAYITKPSWQNDTGCARRTVADVAAVADPNTGVAVYGPVTARRSGWMVFGGTSASAPLIAAVYGVAGVQNLAFTYGHTSALHDITSGNNGSCGGTYLCTGVAGYDGPTGNGTPSGTSAF